MVPWTSYRNLRALACKGRPVQAREGAGDRTGIDKKLAFVFERHILMRATIHQDIHVKPSLPNSEALSVTPRNNLRGDVASIGEDVAGLLSIVATTKKESVIRDLMTVDDTYPKVPKLNNHIFRCILAHRGIVEVTLQKCS